MITFQQLIEADSQARAQERSRTGLTLGRLIKKLENMPANQLVDRVYGPHSYRGYYTDLAFEWSGVKTTAGDLHHLLQEECLNQTFIGYKGGEFTMTEDTPLHVATYGHCGQRMLALLDDGRIILQDPEE